MTRRFHIILACVACILGVVLAESASAQVQTGPPLRPPTNVRAMDRPDDAGGWILISWEYSSDDAGLGGRVVAYRVERGTSRDGPWREVEVLGPQKRSTKDKSPGLSEGGLYNGEDLFYRVVAIGGNGEEAPSAVGDPATATAEAFAWSMTYFMIITLLICGAVVYFIEAARRGKKIFIRKIAGLDAVDEAIGRATEMGSPILFVPGIQDMNDMQTVAGITILGHVSKGVAEYGASLTVPTSRSLVMTAARETVKASYLAVGRPDAYNDDMVYYLTDEQFGYVAAVTGVMVREKPAACFYMGAFYAESLILAETGNTFGAIQIAGTAMPAQLPFFVAACDYTLIGEEFFAASAYLSGEPHQLGSLVGQDFGKLFVLVIAILGTLFLTIATFMGHGSMEFQTAEQAAGSRARITEIGDGADSGVPRGTLQRWELDGISIGENTSDDGQIWVDVIKDDPVQGAYGILLYSDEAKTMKVAEGKGFEGRKILLGPQGESGLSGSVWLTAPASEKSFILKLSPSAETAHGVADWVRSLVEISK
ncbi:MAG: fibronectin type III domain-containing protein [Planctomycetota bacterium]|nr:fibronectin type III domain-containing protein [Planctomycetota bacterium]